MAERPAVICQIRTDRRTVIVIGPIHAGKTLLSKKIPNGTRRLQGKEFTFGVEPLLIEPLYHKRSGCDAGKQQVLVERHVFFMLGIFVISAAVPVGVVEDFGADIFSETTFGERRSSPSGLVWHDHRETVIESPGDQGGLSKTGRPSHEHPGSIKVRGPNYHIHSPHQSPGPRHQA